MTLALPPNPAGPGETLRDIPPRHLIGMRYRAAKVICKFKPRPKCSLGGAEGGGLCTLVLELDLYWNVLSLLFRLIYSAT